MSQTRTTRQSFARSVELRRLSGGHVSEFDEQVDLPALVERAEGDLSELSADELSELRSELATAYAEARPNVESDEQVAALAAVVAAITAVDAEGEARSTAAAEREQQLAALDAQVGADDEDGDEPPATMASEDDEPADDDSDDEGEVVEPEAQQASAPARRADLSVLRRSQRPVETVEPADEPAPGLAFAHRVVAAATLPDLGNGMPFATPEQLGQTISRFATDLRVPDPSDRKFYLGRVQASGRPHAVSLDEHDEDTGSAIDAAVRKVAAARLSDARKVASGGVCLPPQPDYTISTVGERGTPWTDRLATIVGNRPTSYFKWLNMSLTAAAGSRPGARPDGGIGLVTAAQDAAGYGDPAPEGGHLPKDCVRIDCPSPVTENPEAIFRCTTVGNFAAVTWPEYVRVFDETVGFYFDVYRDEQHLAAVVAAAKTLNVAGPTFGAARDLLDALRRLVAHVRSVRKAPNLPFQFDVPAFARYMIAQDLASSWSGNPADGLSASQALALLAVDEGIFLGEYDVSIGATADGSPTVLPELADNAALPDWPTELRIIGYPVGAIFRHDYGELAFGLRETGVSTNDFSGFFELFESVNLRTTDVFTIDVPLCVNGAAGATIQKLCGEDSE